jgi:hypothetical protein
LSFMKTQLEVDFGKEAKEIEKKLGLWQKTFAMFRKETRSFNSITIYIQKRNDRRFKDLTRW